jgi:predicted small metal-binding protein
MAVRWSCVEVDCDWAVAAPDAETIVPLVQQHIADAHDSFELEDMIEAVLEEAPDEAVPGAAPDA